MTKLTQEIDERVILIAQKLVDQEEKKRAELARQEQEKREKEERRIKEMEEKALKTPIQFSFGGKDIEVEYGSYVYEQIMNYVESSRKFVEVNGVLYSLDVLVRVDATKRERELNKVGLEEDGTRKNPISEYLDQENKRQMDEYFNKQIIIEGDLNNDEGRKEALEIASRYLNDDIQSYQKESEIKVTDKDLLL